MIETRNKQSGLSRDDYNPLSPEEEARIRESIAALKEKLPPVSHEPAEPLHAVVTKVFVDGANHTRTVDLANDWKRIGHAIRDAVKQGGEVTLRPLYPGEGVQEHKEYPSTRRIRALEEALAEAIGMAETGEPRGIGAVGYGFALDRVRKVLDAGKPLDKGAQA